VSERTKTRRAATRQPVPESGGTPQWRAVQARDRSADGSFVYAVRSTGIYCRPSCPSRKPLQKHVVFFPLAQAAEQKGFRPCRRCHPRLARVQDPKIGAVAKICRQIDSLLLTDAQSANGSEADGAVRLTLESLSQNAEMSPHQLERAFLRAMGITPWQYADSQRMRRLKRNLKKGDNVTTALYEAGYGSSSRVYERADAHLGMTPASYGRGGEGMHIDYAIADSPLGRLLVAATNRGISALYLGESDKALQAALKEEYPRANICPQDRATAGLADWIDKVLGHLRGNEPSLDLPTDVQATAFQRRVWEELRKIPYGATRTYTDVAHAIGKPNAIRAVARACATNPVSVVVPCHRVVRQDGSLAGYRWGIHRKRQLLEHESATGNAPKVKKARA
jgi:AraC family transcriptional regulator, regulatory protein of adaptative response / methylated-DNA-[protein]-cysteine methyltransferase